MIEIISVVFLDMFYDGVLIHSWMPKLSRKQFDQASRHFVVCFRFMGLTFCVFLLGFCV